MNGWRKSFPPSAPISNAFRTDDTSVLDERLTLLGHEAADLPALSALLQDATLRVPDIGFDRRTRRLVLLVNRYRHEALVPSRVRSALRIETILAVQRQRWPANDDAVLSLLSLTQQDDWLHLVFSGRASLRARIEVIEIVLEDLAAPWPTASIPRHDA
jgi:hypothetical protein